MVGQISQVGRPVHSHYGTLSGTDAEHAVNIPQSESKQLHSITDPSHPHYVKQTCLGAWTSVPYFRWYPQWYFSTIRGAEWFHVYLWLAKDLAWTQDWNYTGIIAGFSAVFWSLFLMFQAWRLRNYVELVHGWAQFLWLSANAWWMFAELHDHDFPDEPRLYAAHTAQAGYVMLVALGWLSLYYMILKPLGLFPSVSKEVLAAYDDSGIFETRVPSLFPTWRSYENIHILFWLGKDCAWNHGWQTMWWIFAVPTVVIALDFVWTTSFCEGHGVDHAHYIVQFIWVLANLVWAYGELYLPQLDEPLPLLPIPEGTDLLTMRWWSAWILVLAFIIVVGLYTVWLPATFTGAIPESTAEHRAADFPGVGPAVVGPAPAVVGRVGGSGGSGGSR